MKTFMINWKALPCPQTYKKSMKDSDVIVGRGGALVESIAFNRRVVGSTPALAAT